MANVYLTYQSAIRELKENRTESGLAAAHPQHTTEKSTYASLFPRDIGICTYGLIASGDADLLKLAKQSLTSLIPSQSPRGQFPQNYEPDTKTAHWWMPGTIDGTLWWSIAALEYIKATQDTAWHARISSHLDRAFTWLTYQDTDNDSLLEQGVAAGWDDEMPRHGTVLYTNTLWFRLITLLVEVDDRRRLLPLKNKIHEAINTLLWVHKSDDRTHAYIPNNSYTQENVYASTMIEWASSQAVYLPYYLGYSAHREFEMRCDVFGNILACLFGVATPEKAKQFTEFALRAGIHLPYPVKVLYPPIYPGEPDWKPYMAKGRQNYPWQYHNGGIWPFVGGFWVWWLSKYDKALAQAQLEQLAEANDLNNMEFNEYLHGQHGTPMGNPHQSWSAAMFVKAYKEIFE